MGRRRRTPSRNRRGGLYVASSLLPLHGKLTIALPQAAVATHALKAAGSKSFLIDPAASAHSAAVGATLASFQWNLKTTTEAKAKLEPVEIGLLGEKQEPSLESEKAKEGRIQLDWETGKVYGEAQNFARTLMELPGAYSPPFSLFSLLTLILSRLFFLSSHPPSILQPTA